VFGLIQVSDKDFDKEIVQSGASVMVDFWAAWCQPCKAMTPMIEELARKYQGKIKFAT
jgi:thioredoxin 1